MKIQFNRAFTERLNNALFSEKLSEIDRVPSDMQKIVKELDCANFAFGVCFGVYDALLPITPVVRDGLYAYFHERLFALIKEVHSTAYMYLCIRSCGYQNDAMEYAQIKHSFECPLLIFCDNYIATNMRKRDIGFASTKWWNVTQCGDFRQFFQESKTYHDINKLMVMFTYKMGALPLSEMVTEHATLFRNSGRMIDEPSRSIGDTLQALRDDVFGRPGMKDVLELFGIVDAPPKARFPLGTEACDEYCSKMFDWAKNNATYILKPLDEICKMVHMTPFVDIFVEGMQIRIGRCTIAIPKKRPTRKFVTVDGDITTTTEVPYHTMARFIMKRV